MESEKIKFKNIIQKIDKRAGLLGANIFSVDFKVTNPKLMTLLAYFLGYFFVIAYSFKIYAGHMEKVVFCGVMFGFLIKGFTQVASFIGQRERFLKIVKDIESLHDSFKTSDDHEISKIFNKFFRFMEILSKLLDIIYLLTGVLSLMYPLMVNFVTGDLILPYGFELPFIDPFSVVGYTCNFFYAASCSALAIIGFTISDAYIVLTIVPIYTLFHVSFHLIDVLKKIDAASDNENEDNKLLYEEKFKEIVQLHQILHDFIRDTEKFYSFTNFIVIYTIFIQCVGSLFALIIVKWYIGATFVVMNLTQIFMYCVFGAILEVVQSQFREKIMELNWIDKNLPERRKFLFILTATQKTAQYTCIFKVLNFETFMGVRI